MKYGELKQYFELHCKPSAVAREGQNGAVQHMGSGMGRASTDAAATRTSASALYDKGARADERGIGVWVAPSTGRGGLRLRVGQRLQHARKCGI